MLIQITNRCHMECPHCMMDSTPDGRHMTDETFAKVLKFIIEAKPMVVNISGGEPTEHPQWASYVKAVLAVPTVAVVTVLTNGAWIEDKKQRITMAKLIRGAKGRLKVQVYSHPRYYRNHEWTVSHEDQYRSIGCGPDFGSAIAMQDLGRARKNCNEEIEDNGHVPSCINSHMIAMQTYSFQQFSSAATQAGKFCRPLIDINGGIHMSESWLCPKVADVTDGVNDAFWKMRESRPCQGCRLYRNFAERFPEEMKILEPKKGS